MAVKLHCLSSLFLGRSGRNLLSTRLLHTSKIKCAPKQYSHAKEDVIAYSKFRKELSESRFQFQKELRAHQEMSMEEFNAQAAEEGRLEREAEDKVLETNRVELERMARKREEMIERRKNRREEKFIRGTTARGVWEEKRTDRKEEEVAQVQSECSSFITMENLEEKIQEIVDNEIEYNFALSTTGKIITY